MADRWLVNFRDPTFNRDNHRRAPRTRVFDREEDADAFCAGLDAGASPGHVEHQKIWFDNEETPDQPDYGWWDHDEEQYEDEFLEVGPVCDGRAWGG